MKKYYYFLFISLLFLAGAVVFAVSEQDITYPVPELGNCKSETDCSAYCDKSENMGPCLNFAEKHNLIPKEDVEIGRKMLTAGQTAGPGGCKGAAQCGEYCDDISHIKECVTFAEKHGLMSGKELEEAKKVAQAFEQGITPPNNCRSKEACDEYCMQPANMRECITFAKEAGLMPPEELEEAEKVLVALDKGITPPPCGNKDACDEYCSAPEHLDECITFAEAAGFMSAEEATMIRRTGGVGPGGCRGKDECEGFCEDPANMGPCVDFAVENGFMSPEEAEQARKMMAAGFTSGPGGCKGQQECESYCDDISHMSDCIDFAEKAGFMTPEEAAKGRKMAEMGISGGPGGCKGEEECRSFCEDSANADTCLNFAVQIGEMTPEQAEEMRGNMEMMQGGGGPGGCTSEEECVSYCQDPSHGIECINFSVQMGQMSPEEGQQMMQMMQGQEQQMPQEGMMPPEGIPEGMGPSQEDMDRMIQEETQRQQQMMEEQIRQQMQQQMPPQSFFEKTKNFLAGLISR